MSSTSLTRRQAIAQLAALAAVPLALPDARWILATDDPLDGTIAAYQAGAGRRWNSVAVDPGTGTLPN
jgi:hypothetical protein